MTIDETPEHLWTAEDVAAYLRVSRSWVYQATERGELPCLRFCRHLRFDPQAIRAWLVNPKASVLPFRQSGP